MLLTLHAYPDSYLTGTDMILDYACWFFTDKKFAAWYERNYHKEDNWTLRLNQLLGMPAKRKNTHIEYTLSVEDFVAKIKAETIK